METSSQAHPAAVQVRPARLQEIDRVAALWTLITEHHAALDPFFRMRTGGVAEGELRELLRAMQRSPDAALFVCDAPQSEAAAEAPGSPVGLCIVRVDYAPAILEETERAEITDIGVRPAYRRRGVATALLDTALEWVRDRGVSRVEIQVAHGNAEGQAFWRARGFADFMDVLHKRL